MRQQIITVTGTASSPWRVLDNKESSFNAGFGCIATGTVSYTVEYTYDNVLDPAITPTAWPHPTVAAKTASADGTFTSVVAAVRVTNVGTGTVVMTLLQAGH